MRVLVTGCAGYVGQVTIRYLLSKNYHVVGMDNFYKGSREALIEPLSSTRFTFIQGDVTKEEDVKRCLDGVDGVIHLAAVVGFPACDRQPRLAQWTNVNGTELLVENAKNIPFVFASTGSVYGKITDEHCTEDCPLNTLSLYGKNKVEAESIVKQHKSSVIFRFATAMGVSPCLRVNLLINDLVYQAVHNRCLTIFQPHFMRTFIHVKEMARAFEFGLRGLLNNTLQHTVYNVGTQNNNMTKKDVAELIKNVTGCVINYQDFDQDMDQRDYYVNYDRLQKAGFYCFITVPSTINELVNVCRVINTMKDEYI